MKISDSVNTLNRIFLDTAPVIYYVENNPRYIASVKTVFDRVDAGLLTVVTSPVTLAECLIAPYRLGLTRLQQDFIDLIVYGHNTLFISIDHERARQAAELRAHYNLTLTDALQISVAMGAGCEAFLTNDAQLRRVTELRMLVLDEFD
jgi:predicted nucleic acid-binding protein